MTNIESYQQGIDAFENQYQYDCTYLRQVLNHHYELFVSFSDFSKLSEFNKALPRDVFFIAKLAAMKVADCGACLELNIRLAQEAGVNPKHIRAAVLEEILPEPLALVFQYASQVANNQPIHGNDTQAMRETYGEDGLAELALAIATASVYPQIKRSMGMANSCKALNLISILQNELI